MSDLTDYYETAIMDHAFRGNDMPSAPSDVYIALHDGDPTESGDANELSASSYDRVAVSTGSGFSGSGGSVSNANEIAFGTAEESWGTVSHFSIWDGSTDTDNPLWYSQLDTSKTIETNDEVRFNAGDLSASID